MGLFRDPTIAFLWRMQNIVFAGISCLYGTLSICTRRSFFPSHLWHYSPSAEIRFHGAQAAWAGMSWIGAGVLFFCMAGLKEPRFVRLLPIGALGGLLLLAGGVIAVGFGDLFGLF